MYFDAQDELPASPSGSDGEGHGNDFVAAFSASLQRLTSGKARGSMTDRVRLRTSSEIEGNLCRAPHAVSATGQHRLHDQASRHVPELRLRLHAARPLIVLLCNSPMSLGLCVAQQDIYALAVPTVLSDCRNGRRLWSGRCRSTLRRMQSSSRSCQPGACHPSSAATSTASALCACHGRRPACQCSRCVPPSLSRVPLSYTDGLKWVWWWMTVGSEVSPCRQFSATQDAFHAAISLQTCLKSGLGARLPALRYLTFNSAACRRQRTHRCSHSSDQPHQPRREMRPPCRMAGMSRRLCTQPG